jgi:hypothetical protein
MLFTFISFWLPSRTSQEFETVGGQVSKLQDFENNNNVISAV